MSIMVTAKKKAPVASKKTTTATPAAAPRKTAAAPVPAKKARAAAGAAVKTAAAAPALKPIKDSLTKAGLTAHLAEQSGVEPKTVKAVLAALEATVLGSVHKKGVRQISLLGLVKIDVLQVAAKKRRFGKDPFSGEERWFPAKPAAVKIKARALKKLKDAAV